MYRIKSFFKKLSRAWRWFRFMYSLPPWNEYDNFLKITSRYLNEMADQFESNPTCLSDIPDSKRMRLAAKLLMMYNDEHYLSQYLQEGMVTDKEGNWPNFNIWKEGYSLQGSMIAEQKDQKCLKLACKIISKDLPGWWQ